MSAKLYFKDKDGNIRKIPRGGGSLPQPEQIKPIVEEVFEEHKSEFVRKDEFEKVSDVLYTTVGGSNIYDGTPFSKDVCIQNWDAGKTTMNQTYAKSGWVTTPIMEIREKVESYVFLDEWGKPTTMQAVGYYDENGVSITIGGGSGNKYDVPSGAKYLRASRLQSESDYNIVSVQPYEEYKGIYYNYPIDNHEVVEKMNVTSSKKRPTVIFDFDQSEIDRRADILEENGFRGTYSYASSNQDAIMKELTKRGHDYSAYCGLSGFNIHASKDEWKAYIQSVLNVLNANNLFFPTVYSCSEHKSSPTLISACKELGFKYIRCASNVLSGESVNAGYGYIYNWVYSNPYDSISVPVGIGDTDISIIKSYIDMAIEKNLTLVLFSHTFDFDGYTESKFTEVVEYVKSKSDMGLLDVLTYRQYFNKYFETDGRDLDFQRILNALIPN